MTRQHLHSTLSRAGILMSLMLLLVAAVGSQFLPVHAVSSPPEALPNPSPTPSEPRMTFDPSEPSTTAGNKVTITAKVFDKDRKDVTLNQAGQVTNSEWSWTVADPSLKEFLVIDDSKGNQATVVGLFGNSKSGAARPNMIPIIVTFSGTPKVTGVVNVRLEDAPLERGPIPPGIEPQVDIMWAVMPQNVAHDNFGSKIRKQYYAIEAVIGNDSGYDLELASVGFDLRAGELDTARLTSTRIPTSGYRVARASLQRRQQLSLRNMTLNIIKALGPVLTGFTPFFHNIEHTNNFAEGINILSNPIEKGFELVWPDLTLGQLANLEDQSLRDNAITRTVVKNNTQVRFVVFIPKDLINDRQTEDNAWRDKPLEVMKHLGRMILIGDQVEHINRVRVVSSPETGAAFSISGRVTDACLTPLKDATITLSQAGGFTSTTKTDAAGRYSFDNVPAGLTYTVTASKTDTTFSSTSGNNFTLHGNRTNVDFSTAQPPFTISGKVTDAAGTALVGVDVVLSSRSGAGTFQSVTKKTVEGGLYSFDPVPGGAVYNVAPKSSPGKTFQPQDVSDCSPKTVNFKAEPQ